MVSTRDRILSLIDYIKSLGIEVNISKNKARGNKGVFLAKPNFVRIDVAKGLSEEEQLRILAHEFAHFIHYKLDKSLQSLSFAFGKDSSDIDEELINLTVHSIPKAVASDFFKKKEYINSEIKNFALKLTEFYPDFKISTPYKKIEQKIKKTPLKHLLRYDRVRVLDLFDVKIYSVESLSEDCDINLYLKLKSKQRALRRINSKISKINRYYNSKTELFARFFEYYITDYSVLERKAPNALKRFEKVVGLKQIPLINEFKSRCF